VEDSTVAVEAVAVAESALEVEALAVEKQAERKKEPKRVVEEEEEDGDVSKDGVNLDELFSIKPEMFQAAAGTEDDSDDKKKGKKGKKKGVALEFDEKLGEVVTRKKHKRGDGDAADETEW
jgi:hypothetical protein